MVSDQDVRPAIATGHRESWLVLSALLAAAFLGTLDTTVVNIALHTVQRDFNASLQQAQLVGSAYIVAFAASLVLGGKAGDKFGRRAAFRTGVVLFCALSVGCALAPSLPALIALRAVQGLSAALMVPQVLAIIKASFPRKAQVGMSLYGATLGLATISGLIVGGLLVGLVGWRSIFLINVPVCAFIVLVTRNEALPESRGMVGGFDVLGPVLLTLAMVTILAPVSLPSLRSPGRSAIAAVAFVVLLAGFWRHEKAVERRRGEDIALVPPAIFRRRSVGVGLFILGVYFVGTAGFNVVLVYYLQQGDGLSQTVTGLLSSALGAGFALGSAMAHRVTARLGPAAIVLGCVLMVVTRLLLIAGQSLHHAAGLAGLAVLIAVTGAAQGIVVPPLMNVVLGSVTTRLSGVASGVLLTICNCAIALGQAVFLALYSAVRFPAQASAPFVTTLWVMTALAAVAALVSAFALRMFRRDQGVVHEDSIPQ